MKLFDMGIQYNSKIIEVRSTISKLEELSFDLSSVKTIVDNLDKKVKDDIKKSSEKNTYENRSPFANDVLVYIYSDAIKKLDTINSQLQREYDDYYKISIASKKLRKSIKNTNKDNIDEKVNQALKLLNSMKESSTIDFDTEKNVVNEVYKLIYEVLKLETVNSSKTELLDTLRSDSVDTQYISELIKKDMSKIKDSNGSVKSRILDIEKGLDDRHLLDKKLLLLILLGSNRNMVMNSREDLLKNINLYKKLMSELERAINQNGYCEDNISDLERRKNYKKSSLFNKKLLVAADVILLLALTVGLPILSRNAIKTKKYKTYTRKYDSYSDTYEDEEKYLSGKDESVKITEYSPWDSPGYFRKNYTRNVYKYNVKNLNYDFSKVSMYLDKDIKLESDYTSKTETSKTVPEDYGYGENKFIVEETKIDWNDYIYEKISLPIYLLLCSLYSLLIGSADYFVLRTVLDDISELKENIDSLNRKINENDEEIDDLDDEIEDLKDQLNNLREIILSQYEVLPEVLREEENIKEGRELVKAKLSI